MFILNPKSIITLQVRWLNKRQWRGLCFLVLLTKISGLLISAVLALGKCKVIVDVYGLLASLLFTDVDNVNNVSCKARNSKASRDT